METNRGCKTIRTGTDGYIGAITEYKSGRVIDAIKLEMGLNADLFEIKEIEAILKSLF